MELHEILEMKAQHDHRRHRLNQRFEAAAAHTSAIKETYDDLKKIKNIYNQTMALVDLLNQTK
jgi:hypothetical protein